MATATVTIGDVDRYNIIDGRSARSEAVTTSGTAASGALVATVGQVALINCPTAVYARSGDTVTAATGAYVQAGVERAIYMGPGETVSLIDA